MLGILITDHKSFIEFCESVSLFLTDTVAYGKTERKFEDHAAIRYFDAVANQEIPINVAVYCYVMREGKLVFTYYEGHGVLAGKIRIENGVIRISGVVFRMMEDELLEIFAHLGYQAAMDPYL